jgi:hypothetical protein
MAEGKVKVDVLIWDDHVTVSELCASAGTGKLAVLPAIIKLGHIKDCTRWVLKILTVKHQNSPKKTSVQKYLQQCYKDRDVFLSRIITSDET